MASRLPHEYDIGQTVEYSRWSIPHRKDQVDEAIPVEPPDGTHTGFIAGFAFIQEKYYYMVMCGRKIELVMPEDIVSASTR